MTKRDVIEAIVQQYPRCSRREAERMVNAVFASTTAALRTGERIELRGFGSFVVKQRAASVGRNPRTGARITVAAKNVLGFKVSKELRARVKGTSPPESARAAADGDGNEASDRDEEEYGGAREA